MGNTGIIREHSNLVNIFLKIIDLFAIYWSGVVAYHVSGVEEFFKSVGQPTMPTAYIIVLLLAMLLAASLFPLFSFYRTWRGASIFEELKWITIAWIILAALLATLALMTKTGASFSRMWGGVWFLCGWVFLIGFRIMLRLFLRWMRTKGFNQRHIVIVGTGGLAMEVAERINAASWLGLKILGFFGPPRESSELRLKHGSVIGDYKELSSYVEKHAVDQIWIAMPLSEVGTVKSLLHSLRHTTLDIRYIPDIYSFQLLNHSITEIAGLPVVNLAVTPMEGLNRWLKAIEDQVLAFIILVLSGPLMLLIALAIKLSSRGPAFYRQVRVSWNGEPFVMLKFRTMKVGSETETGPIWAKKGEARVTRLGAFLRKTSLDELPQFINVLRGDMSIVGPRPERPTFVELFKDEIPDYMKKHMVKAGITGWAQINGWRGNTDIEKRVEHDIYYIENWSLWLDLKIIVLTLFKGLINENAY